MSCFLLISDRSLKHTFMYDGSRAGLFNDPMETSSLHLQRRKKRTRKVMWKVTPKRKRMTHNEKRGRNM